MGSITNNLQEVKGRISSAAQAAGRTAQDITLLAVTKTFGPAAVREAVGAGQRAFGENYVQEALAKIEQLADLRHSIEWHLIGPLQSNKTRVVAEHFDWVQSVDRLKIAERLSAQRRPDLPALNVCLQVNISGEASKSGLTPAEVVAVAQAVAKLPRLRLRGLMAVPEAAVDGADPAALRAPHQALHALFETLVAQGLPLDTVSTGMSADLEPAIAAGSTMVRVGSAIFGHRM
ncbi:MAG: YggS family pyridoxal phosphate-dependent enzyme [Pseudomonadota bacterium]|nr:YggS family pyridoxal phosphate-dependent enzyme [Pseudomonadota bacterium]